MGSSAQLLLLSKFRGGNSPERYREDDAWKTVLGGDPSSTIELFLQEGLLEEAGLPELVDYKFKLADLKALAKACGLKVSGRKDELSARLIERDTVAMREATNGLVLYRCTEKGLVLAKRYLEEQDKKRAATEQDVLTLLLKRNYPQAVQLVAQYEATQVFARGLGIDWKNYDESHDVESLMLIFGTTPAILDAIDRTRLQEFRLPAGMMHLWGSGSAKRWLRPDLETGIHLDADTVCRMLVFHASFQRNMNEMKRAGVARVEILGGGDDGLSCSECRKIEGKQFNFADVPELPYAQCTCNVGCRCTAVTADFR